MATNQRTITQLNYFYRHRKPRPIQSGRTLKTDSQTRQYKQNRDQRKLTFTVTRGEEQATKV
jgi:hypothetical protein